MLNSLILFLICQKINYFYRLIIKIITMKKIILLAVFALFSNSLFSQQWDGAANFTDDISRNGNVSIGTTQNVDKLTLANNFTLLNGNINFGYVPPSRGQNRGNNYGINYYAADSGVDLAGNSFNNPAGLYFYPNNGDDFFIGARPSYIKVLVLGRNHKIGMGTDNFTCNNCMDYRLFVKDGIKTEKVKVEIAASNGWADYVFKKDYKLMPLKDLQSYIDENGHLPEVPTTEEAITNGIELKEMNILLLKKVEELTLYTLQQQKNIEEQNKRIETLEKKLNK